MARLTHYATSGPLYFYGGPFSSFAMREIHLVPAYYGVRPELDELVPYTTREAYFQSAKGCSRAEHDYVLGDQANTWQVKERGQSRTHVTLRPDWDIDKGGAAYAVMLTCIRHEMLTDRGFAEILLASGDRQIAEDSPADFIWGIRDEYGGMTGLNLLGLALMQARAEMQHRKRTWAMQAYDAGWIGGEPGEDGTQKHVLAAVLRTYGWDWLDADPCSLRPPLSTI